MENKICDYLRRNGKSSALEISKELGLEKSTVNSHLYKLMKSNQVFICDNNKNRPVWDLVERMNEKRQEPQEPQTTSDTCEEKQVRGLLKSGGLKASQIATELGQKKQPVNKLLYSMMEKGEVCKTQSNLWTLNDEKKNKSDENDSEHKLASISGLSASFNVIKKLGGGAYGHVYKVQHKFDDKIYAVKRVKLKSDADLEVKALARLDHPNIVRYFTCWPDSVDWMSEQKENEIFDASGYSSEPKSTEGSGSEEEDDADDVTSVMESLDLENRTYLYIQMAFCEGGTLTSWIEERNFKGKQRDALEIHQILYGIISGVEYIHSNSLIHRDLKPDNILFSDGEVKIGDFGLVAAQTKPNGDPIERSKRKGTPTYMSPEQENLRKYDEKTDIFPLGLIWFEMLWKMSSGMERAAVWSDLRNQTFPQEFCERFLTENKFIEKMLSFTPADRPHAKDIRLNLETFFTLHKDSLSQRTI